MINRADYESVINDVLDAIKEMRLSGDYDENTLEGLEWRLSNPTTPCDVCGTPVASDIHEEELGMCVDCSNDYFDHKDEETE